jgi:hypothetical protein
VALLSAGACLLDAAVEAGHAGLAACLFRRLRAAGAEPRALLLGGAARPAGLPLLHLALLSGDEPTVRLAARWAQRQPALRGMLRPVALHLPAAPAAPSPGLLPASLASPFGGGAEAGLGPGPAGAR